MSGYVREGDSMILISTREQRGISDVQGHCYILCHLIENPAWNFFGLCLIQSLVYQFFSYEIRYLPHPCYSTAKSIWLSLLTYVLRFSLAEINFFSYEFFFLSRG